MKKTFLLGILCSASVFAQGYDFEMATEVYEPLNGSTLLSNGLIWDDPEYSFPLGFNFMIGETILSNIYLYEAAITNQSVDENITGVIPVLFPFGTDLIDRAYDQNENSPGGVSPISFLIDGTPGNRIAKIEFKNVGFYDEYYINDSTDDFANFQVWLYETSNIIEYRFGESSINNPDLAFIEETGPYVAVLPDLDLFEESSESGVALSGNASNPTAIPATFIFENFINGMPPGGIVYRFTPQALSVNDLKAKINIQIYPNPVQHHLNIQVDQAMTEVTHLKILNLQGQLLMEQKGNTTTLDVSRLTSGVYLLEINTNIGSISERFIKQ